jgi:hypothetical protein
LASLVFIVLSDGADLSSEDTINLIEEIVADEEIYAPNCTCWDDQATCNASLHRLSINTLILEGNGKEESAIEQEAIEHLKNIARIGHGKCSQRILNLEGLVQGMGNIIDEVAAFQLGVVPFSEGRQVPDLIVWNGGQEHADGSNHADDSDRFPEGFSGPSSSSASSQSVQSRQKRKRGAKR